MKCKFCEWEKHYKKIIENDHAVAVWGSPYVRGHVKVILKTHYDNLHEVPRNEAQSLMDLWQKVAAAIQQVIHPDIINYQINGNWMRHIHGHIYPRWESDPDWGEPVQLPTKEQAHNKEYFAKELSPDDIKRIEDILFHKGHKL